MDVLQSLSGLLLVLFVWAHMFFESSIMLGMDAMYWVSRMFEGEHLLGRPYPLLVSAAGLTVFLLIAGHAPLTAFTAMWGDGAEAEIRKLSSPGGSITPARRTLSAKQQHGPLVARRRRLEEFEVDAVDRQ